MVPSPPALSNVNVVPLDPVKQAPVEQSPTSVTSPEPPPLGAGIHVPTPTLFEVNTYPALGFNGILKACISAVPATYKALGGITVPMPTLPPVNNAEFVALLNVETPVNVLLEVPLCVYEEEFVIPTDVSAPEEFIEPWQVEPTQRLLFGIKVPIPTLALVTFNTGNPPPEPIEIISLFCGAFNPIRPPPAVKEISWLFVVSLKTKLAELGAAKKKSVPPVDGALLAPT